MYVQKRSWLENGPRPRVRRCAAAPAGRGLGTDINPYPFLDGSDQSGDCTFGGDPSNPLCLSPAGLAAQQRLAAAAAGGPSGNPSGAGGGITLGVNSLVYGAVGLAFVFMLARR